MQNNEEGSGQIIYDVGVRLAWKKKRGNGYLNMYFKEQRIDHFSLLQGQSRLSISISNPRDDSKDDVICRSNR